MSQIAGYTYNAGAYHPECFPRDVDPNGEGVGAVFNWDDAACELTCDVCFQPLLECDYGVSDPEQLVGIEQEEERPWWKFW